MGNLGTQKIQILSELVRLEAIQENRLLSEEETIMKASFLMVYEEHLKNTSYFHKLANAHRRSNHIDQLVV